MQEAENPDEGCFQKTPLNFVGKMSTIDYTNPLTKDLEIPALDTTEGTSPKGSMWRKNPIPFCVWLTEGPSTSCPLGAQFKPPVKGTPVGYGPFNDWVLADNVQVPDVEGEYVLFRCLSWRWDCEEFYPGQVWTTCSNIRITGSGPAPAPAPSGQKYACRSNTCIAAASGADLTVCQSACGSR